MTWADFFINNESGLLCSFCNRTIFKCDIGDFIENEKALIIQLKKSKKEKVIQNLIENNVICHSCLGYLK